MSRLLPCPGYCKHCCNELWVHVSLWIMVFSGYMSNSGISRTYCSFVRTSLMDQQVKNLPGMQMTQEMVQSLGWEAPLEEEMTTHSSILAISTYPSAIVLTLIYICIRKDFPCLLIGHIPVIWHVYLLFFEENTGKFHSIIQHQLYNTILSVIVILLYIRSSEFIIFIF